MQNVKFKPCPKKPNCVSSLAEDLEHAIAPLSYAGDWLIAKQTLVEILQQIPRAEIVADENNYLHATFKSRMLGFVDDVEFLFDDSQHIIHVRSASRVGYYDFGVNRKRIEGLRRML